MTLSDLLDPNAPYDPSTVAFDYPSTTDAWLYAIIRLVLIGLVLFFAWKQVLPMVKKTLAEYIQAPGLVSLLINLIMMIVVVSAASMVISVISIGKVGQYISLLNSGIAMAQIILDQVKWLAFIGILLFLGFGLMKNKGAGPQQ